MTDGSAGGNGPVSFAATREIDLGLDRVQPDGTDEHVVADDIGRRPVDAHRFRKHEAFRQRCLDFLAGHIFFQAARVDADFLGNRKGARFVSLTTAVVHLLMEVEVLLTGGPVLHMQCDCDLGGLGRSFTQHGELLEHDAQVGIVLNEVHHVGHRPIAIAAIVIEELHHGDIATRVAEDHMTFGIEDGLSMLGDGRPHLFCGGVGLLLVHLADDFLQKFGVAHEIFTNNFLDFAALFGRERLRKGDQGGPMASTRAKSAMMMRRGLSAMVVLPGLESQNAKRVGIIFAYENWTIFD